MNVKRESATIYDVAKLAGVSVTTVSRVLSHSSYPVSLKTQQKVIRAAEDLGYLARQTGSSDHNVVVMVPNLTNPYYLSLVAGLETSLRNMGMDMVLANSQGSLEMESRLIKEAVQRSCLRLIISPVGESYDHISELVEQGIAVIIIEQHLPAPCTSICFNYVKGGTLATQYLIERGLRKIAFISSPLTKASRKEVFDGYLAAMKQNRIPVENRLIKIAEHEEIYLNDVFEYSNGAKMVCELLKSGERPEAIFCANDVTAVGALQQLQKLGFRVPEDISLMGFDNIHFSAMTNPPLTTIDQCTYELGNMAAEILNGTLQNPHRKKLNITLEPRLVIRESVR